MQGRMKYLTQWYDEIGISNFKNEPRNDCIPIFMSNFLLTNFFSCTMKSSRFSVYKKIAK